MKEYGYGRLPNVITSLDFERLTHASGPTGGKVVLKNGKAPESVAIIHCVGSRDHNYNEYCSRVCCMYSLKTAHLVQEKTAGKVYEFYIDMRAFGKGYEEFYKRLLEEDVTFIRGRVAEVTNEKGKLIVVAEDTLLGIVRRIPVDMVILAVGLEPRRDTHDVARIFSISRSTDGFFLEKHPKLARRCQRLSMGSSSQGLAKGRRISQIAWRKEPQQPPTFSHSLTGRQWNSNLQFALINEASCSGCRICVDLCPYHAITYDNERKLAGVNEALFKGCGAAWQRVLPATQIEQQNFTNRQLLAEIEAICT